MHGDLRAALFERHLELFDKQPLAADLAQAAVEDLVALRGHAQQVHAVPARLQERLHVLGLPQREAAFARGDHKRGGGGFGRGHRAREGK